MFERRVAWVLGVLAAGCANEATGSSASTCLSLPTERGPDAALASPSSSCGQAVFGQAALAAFDNFLESLLVRECERGVRCGLYPDVMSCRATHPATGWSPLRAGVMSGRTGMVERAGDTLLEWLIPAASCTQMSYGSAFESALQLVFPGQAKEGESCGISNDCAGDSRCDQTACASSERCCSGVCKPFRRSLALGEACAYGECAGELECVRIVSPDGDSDEVARCYPALREGDACEASFGNSCEGGTSCILDASGQPRCSLVPPIEGEPCATESGSVGCAELDVDCAGAQGCVRRQDVGSSCAEAPCVAHASCVDGICQPRAGLGDACEAIGSNCGVGLQCDTSVGRCAPWPEPIACGG